MLRVALLRFQGKNKLEYMIWGGIYRENWGWLGNQMEGSGKRRKVIGKHICQHC